MAFSTQFIEGYNKKMINRLNTIFSQSYIKFKEKELDQLNQFIQILAAEYGKETKRNGNHKMPAKHNTYHVYRNFHGMGICKNRIQYTSAGYKK